MKFRFHLIAALAITSLFGCSGGEQSLKVTASAYTSSVGETDSTPNLAAWGDILEPGMKSIAVSRDLLKMGLTHNQEVRIEGFDGTYRVLDKMNKRWEKKIDIYMGNDVKKARQWGKQEVVIYWTVEEK
ncbi:3D domain-containing protein [Moritella sp. 24]|uniref:3D domain-containing protein n=1 Tax=Moritella sp. 24 TaxID=2746230 RepID=UPI001BA563AA|nr:3D domain-containing protein [Moritella sp. 24]QUM75740.1 3D domain-containing protein [Moritella sp. 24]